MVKLISLFLGISFLFSSCGSSKKKLEKSNNSKDAIVQSKGVYQNVKDNCSNTEREFLSSYESFTQHQIVRKDMSKRIVPLTLDGNVKYPISISCKPLTNINYRIIGYEFAIMVSSSIYDKRDIQAVNFNIVLDANNEYQCYRKSSYVTECYFDERLMAEKITNGMTNRYNGYDQILGSTFDIKVRAIYQGRVSLTTQENLVSEWLSCDWKQPGAWSFLSKRFEFTCNDVY